MTPTDMSYNLLMNYCTEESVLILLDGDGVCSLGGVGDVAPGNSIGALLENSGKGQREADLACLRILGDGSASQRGFFRSGTYCWIPGPGRNCCPFQGGSPIVFGIFRIVDDQLFGTTLKESADFHCRRLGGAKVDLFQFRTATESGISNRGYGLRKSNTCDLRAAVEGIWFDAYDRIG